jgi:phage FluMu gp28-like protein
VTKPISTQRRKVAKISKVDVQTSALPRERADMCTDNVRDQSRSTADKAQAAKLVNEALVRFRGYQLPVFMDRESGILILHWSRQIGKSYTLASWAVDRLLTQLSKYDSWLITVLSNSRDNGAEFVIKCQDVCNKLGMAMAKPAEQIGDAMVYNAQDDSPDVKYENMRMEVRVTLTVDGRERVGRIKVLAANPRTARGFSGDLILDEFAFHEDSNAIWEAAEPILSANPEFLCRIASTGNGKHNMFYRMCAGAGPNDGTVFISAAGFKVCRVTRAEAWKMGVKIYDPNTRKPITPEQARQKSLDKRAYDQNYECLFNDENMCCSRTNSFSRRNVKAYRLTTRRGRRFPWRACIAPRVICFSVRTWAATGISLFRSCWKRSARPNE